MCASYHSLHSARLVQGFLKRSFGTRLTTKTCSLWVRHFTVTPHAAAMSMYKRLTEIPAPVSATFTSPSVVQVASSFHDHLRNTKPTTKATFTLSTNPPIITPQQNDSNVVGIAYSPSKKLRVALVENSKDEKRFIEIWNQDGNTLQFAIEVTESHKSFLMDEHIASLAFSPDERSVLYTAEANIPEDDPYAKFRFMPHFGEGIVGKKRPTIFILSWRPQGEQPRLSPVTTNSSALFAQAVFGPHGDRIFATGYEYTADHRFLGIKYCINRPSGIWEISLPNETDREDTATTLSCTARKLTPSTRSCRSPRLLSGEKGKEALIWLSAPTGGPHDRTSSLHALDVSIHQPVSPDSVQTLVEVVDEPAKGQFPGLYPGYNLPAIPFVRQGDSNYLVTTSFWGSRTTVLLISLSDGAVQDLTPQDDNLYSWKVLATDEAKQVICVRSTPSSPGEVVLGRFNDNLEVTWTVLQKPNLAPEVQEALDRLQSSIIPVPNRGPTEAIVIQPGPTDPSRPCITTPHGGPHGTYTTAFVASTAALALEGYTVAQVNYTGSLGYGESQVRALIGKCGTLDVEDCIETTRHLIRSGIASEGPGQQFYSGGSHGGFLGGHLIGQYPDVYTAAVLRNPVISAAEMTNTDIPDWYFAEFGLDYPMSSSPAFGTNSGEAQAAPSIVTPEIFKEIFDASPMAHVHKVRAGVLLLIGAVDLRVAPGQGMNYYHALKGLRYGKKDTAAVEMLVFDGESHPLDGVESQRVGWEAARDFYARERQRAQA